MISATATGRTSPPATIRLRVTSRQAPSSVTDRSVPRHTTKSCSARGSSSLAATSRLRISTMRSPAGSGSVGESNSASTWKMTVPTPIANAMASPPTMVRPGYFTSMRPPSLRSSSSASSQRKPYTSCPASLNFSTPPKLTNARRRASSTGSPCSFLRRSVSVSTWKRISSSISEVTRSRRVRICQ